MAFRTILMTWRLCLSIGLDLRGLEGEVLGESILGMAATIPMPSLGAKPPCRILTSIVQCAYFSRLTFPLHVELTTLFLLLVNLIPRSKNLATRTLCGGLPSSYLSLLLHCEVKEGCRGVSGVVPTQYLLLGTLPTRPLP